MDFVALDVETANPDLSSICQIGIVGFREGVVSDRWKTLINPKTHFDPVNVRIHGIDEDAVVEAPTFIRVFDELQAWLEDRVACHHTPFDRASIQAACRRQDIRLPVTRWLDTAKVVRRTWVERSHSGYGLRPMAEMLGINFQHHDAEEDARAAGEILLAAMKVSGSTLEEVLLRAEQPLTERTSSSRSEKHNRDGNPDGPLQGEVAVFTGALSIPRREAADLAASAGCDVASSVTKKTTLVIVGDQDVVRLAGHSTSSKQRKAEQAIHDGQDLRILRESDFSALVAMPG